MNRFILITLVLCLSGCTIALDPNTIQVVYDEQSKQEIQKAIISAYRLGYLTAIHCEENNDFNYCMDEYDRKFQ